MRGQVTYKKKGVEIFQDLKKRFIFFKINKKEEHIIEFPTRCKMLNRLKVKSENEIDYKVCHQYYLSEMERREKKQWKCLVKYKGYQNTLKKCP